MRLKLEVTAYRESGKYYTGHTALLTEEETSQYVYLYYDLQEKVKENCPSVHHLSPLVGGFTKGYVYIFNVDIPANKSGFCNFMVNKLQERS
jgi:hypothetical protein